MATGLKRSNSDIADVPRRRRLKGPEKAAILFLCLGERRGSALMQALDPEEIQSMTRAISRLGPIDSPQVEKVMEEFTENAANGGNIVGTFSVAERLLRNFLPEDQVNAILKDISGPLKVSDLWDRFSAMNENVIANYLKGEHVQTVAAILTNVKVDVAARVLPLLGMEMMQEVVERMICIDVVPNDLMKEIEETLKADLISTAGEASDQDMQQHMAELLNRIDPEVFSELSAVLEERLPDDFERIKQRMFTFDDLVKLDPVGLARVMRGVPGSTLPLALRGASEAVRSYFLDVLPARSREMLVDEMSSMGPVRGRQVRDAQALMIDYAKELAEDEVINLPSDEDDDDFI